MPEAQKRVLLAAPRGYCAGVDRAVVTVEEALKLHPTVNDAVVVGVPDDKFGQAITAVVEPAAGATVDEASLIAEVKAHLAPYKAPKRVLVVDTIGRAPNGKVDYKRHLTYALDVLGIEPSPIPVANA